MIRCSTHEGVDTGSIVVSEPSSRCKSCRASTFTVSRSASDTQIPKDHVDSIHAARGTLLCSHLNSTAHALITAHSLVAGSHTSHLVCFRLHVAHQVLRGLDSTYTSSRAHHTHPTTK